MCVWGVGAIRATPDEEWTGGEQGWEAGLRFVGVGTYETVDLHATVLLIELVKPRGAQGTWEAHRTSVL